MIEAQDHSLFTPLVRGYTQWSLRGHVAAVRWQVMAPDSTPTSTLFHATHVSWWDGYLGLCVAGRLGLRFRTAMLEQELRKYMFLRFAGGFGFTPANLSSLREMLEYAKQELNSSQPTAMLIFPSGHITSPNLRPIAYQPGTASLAIAAAKDVPPVPVRALAWRLEHRGQARPEVYVRVGPARLVNGHERLRNLTDTLREDLTLEADTLAQDLMLENLDAYSSALQGLPSAQEGWDALRGVFNARPV